MADQPFRVGEGVMAEREAEPLGPGIDLGHICHAAEDLDGDRVKKVARFIGNRPETVDKFRR